ncbi:signal transduction histidine kinase/ActR/RegA family two-component response regulator/HAMP domain-containing protein [Azospirillum fermentarium]|uniref:ATP-binding protein n=1 Tax=Azospirillum fermentarium TaxID=1233114 RepID=UPI002225EA1B|nr:ATP-binding protein [Azospirillum fermentarium]MCW2247636.1 signal transduction histidine kinase/ActR/RegA family two-component response regulator/HAMP domain-containing protein [Azospirillum fermentarium]
MRTFSDLPLFVRLLAAFLVVLVLFSALALLGYRKMERIGVLADQIYDHPFTVGTAIRDIRNAADQAHALAENLRWEAGGKPPEVIRAGIQASRKAVAAALERISGHYLGPAEDVESLRWALDGWAAAQDRFLAMAPGGSPGMRVVLLQDEGERYGTVSAAIGRIVAFSGNKARELHSQSQAIIADTLRNWGLAIAGIGVLLVLLAWVVTRSLTAPLTRLCGVMRDLTAGRLEVDIPYRGGRSEIGTIADTLAGFQGTARRLSEQGCLDARVAAIAAALQAQSTHAGLARVLLPYLTDGLPEGSWAALYVRRGSGWMLAGAEGGDGGRHLPEVLDPAVVAMADAAAERAVDHVAAAMDGTMPLRLALSVRGQAVGVLLIFSPADIPRKAMDLLDRVKDLLALGIEGLRRREQAEILLARTSEQAWELEVRAEALRGSEEKLRMANEELSQQAAALAEQRQQIELAWAEAEQKAREAENANRHKSEFLANMSHEIRTPLNAILGLTYLLERTALNREQDGHVGKIGLAGRSLLSIVNDILDFSRIEAGRLELECTAFNLPGVMEAITAMAGVNAQAKALDFRVDVAPGVPDDLAGDGFRLQQILVNLTGNAIKFTETGSVRLSVEQVPAEGERVMLRFTVSDTGIGIPPDALPGLFRAFSQADTTTTRRFGGSGLGLAISRKLVEMMGGSIAVDSTPGQGSRFTVEIPFAAAAPANPVPVHIPAAAPAPLAGVRILLVEDNSINRLVASRILEGKGAAVVCEADGQAAVDRLNRAPGAFDVVLMDVQMPVMDGYEATAVIKKDLRLRHLPVIALTAGALASERKQAVDCGMDGFISKPFAVGELVDTVARFAPVSTAV